LEAEIGEEEKRNQFQLEMKKTEKERIEV